MELILLQDDPLNTVLSNTNGTSLYSISTPSKWTSKTTTILKHALDESGRPMESSHELAVIQWHNIRSTQLIYDGKTVDINDFIPRTGWGR